MSARFESLLIAVLVANSALYGQSPAKKPAPASSRSLVLTAAKELKSVPAGMLVLPERCDGSGNLYLWLYSQDQGIKKIDSDGKEVATIPNGEIPDVPHPKLHSFNVDGSGNVYLLASARPAPGKVGRYVLLFDSKGQFKSMAKVDPGFDWLPAFVAAFSSGDLLVSGARLKLDSGERTRRPFTGIFSSDGTFRKEVTLPDDQKLHDVGESGDPHLISAVNPESNGAFSFGSAETGSDGNIYLMRASNPPIVYAISPGGEVTKRFVVDLGEDAGFSPLEPLHVLGSRIAIFFHNNNSGAGEIKIVNSGDARTEATYITPAGGEAGPGLACWTAPDRFTFIGEADDGYVSVRYFEPR